MQTRLNATLPADCLSNGRLSTSLTNPRIFLSSLTQSLPPARLPISRALAPRLALAAAMWEYLRNVSSCPTWKVSFYSTLSFPSFLPLFFPLLLTHPLTYSLTHTHSHTDSLTHPLTHSPTHSLTHSLTLIHILKHSYTHMHTKTWSHTSPEGHLPLLTH